MTSDKNNVHLIPLGGCGEIGMNCLVLETQGRLLIVDCGVMFPAADQPGVDIIHPCFDYLVERRHDIEGIFLTHGHEDHIAALPYLLQQIELSIYSSNYTLQLVKKRLMQQKCQYKSTTINFEPNSKVTLGPFDISSFEMPHSFASNMGFLIQTAGGNILHTGDFKLNGESPLLRNTVLAQLKQISANGIDLMLCDATGAETTEPAKEEQSVYKHLNQLIQDAKRSVFVAIFSSNVRRMQILHNIAANANRKIVILGRSAVTHTKIGLETLELKIPHNNLISVDDIHKYPPQQLLYLVSGTQGESRSALGRLAAGCQKNVSIEADDLVIFSSRFIPGNELAISKMIDQLIHQGAKVIHTGQNKGIHVSGHGSIVDIQQAIQAVSPKGFMPVHGTLRHLTAARTIAENAQVPNTILATNGQRVCLNDGSLSLSKEEIHCPKTFVDKGGSISDVAMKDRRLLGNSGALFVCWTAGNEGFPQNPITVVSKGVFSGNRAEWFEKQIANKVLDILAEMNFTIRTDHSTCEETVRRMLRKFSSKTLQREPYVIVSIQPPERTTAKH